MSSTASEPEQELLKQIAAADLSELMAIWGGRTVYWARWPEVYRQLTRRILAHGEPLLAYDVAAEARSTWPNDVVLRQLRALALSRTGATDRANALLEQLRSEGATDEETLGMLARTYKDLAIAAKSPEREQLFKRAAEIYAEAYRQSGGYWTGINAATMSLLIGDENRAQKLAEQVRQQCLAEVQDTKGDSYWEYAALGEAALICRDWSEAEQWYARAAAQAKERFADLQSSRRNARLILSHWSERVPAVEQHLRVPPVIVFTGHMIDRPGRRQPRFPAESEALVAQWIRQKIEEAKPGFGFSSAACGADILFLEAMLEHGAEISVVLPFQRERFIADSVDIIPGSNWRARFEAVLKGAVRVVSASADPVEVGGVSYDFYNQLLLGLATIRARQLETALIPMAVWNGQIGDGPGGAASVVEHWNSLGLDPVIIDLPPVAGVGDSGYTKPDQKSNQPRSATPATTQARKSNHLSSRIVSILFADVVGFSKLTEAEVPRFFEHFLGGVAGLSRNFDDSILTKDTWGDALYFVFAEADAAGQFALEVADFAAKTNWSNKGLPSGLNLRIGLNAGPVYELDDPITGCHTYTGTHVSRAARIEPITPPGNVYASENFAAVAAAHGVKGFTCDYVGQMPLAKGYGSLPTYHVRRV